MQAYASAKRHVSDDRLRVLDSMPLVPFGPTSSDVDSSPALLDQLLSRIADLVVHRLMQHGEVNASDRASDWMDARGAAAYLGIHRDTLRKLAAQRTIPAHQDGPRCKLYFRRDELDHWRRSARPASAGAATLGAVS